jgi:hypothetical protein
MAHWIGFRGVTIVTLCKPTRHGASRASADTFKLIGLNVSNDAISGFVKDYAFEDVGLVNPSVALVTLTTSVVGGGIYLVGGIDAVDVNVNADSWSIGNIEGINAGTGFTPGPFTDGGSGHVDGFGVFNQRVDSFDGFSHSSHSVSFVLTNTSGTWSSAERIGSERRRLRRCGSHLCG